jgi:hypothetical protein
MSFEIRNMKSEIRNPNIEIRNKSKTQNANDPNKPVFVSGLCDWYF